MKNIHLIPTDKPSRLCLDSKDKLWFAPNSGYTIADGKQNIYITSDEEIKVNDWGYSEMDGIGNWNGPILEHEGLPKKIILTTDQDLIKDGVQSIDNEFLEWFVKNPSCENVEVIKYEDNNILMLLKDKTYHYKITIPKEEKTKPHSFCETPNEKCTMNYCDENGCINRKRELVNIIQNKTNLEKLPFTKLFKEFAEYYKNVSLVEKTKQGRTCTNNCSVVCGECHIFDKEPITKEKPCKHFTPTIGCIKDICSCNDNHKKAHFNSELVKPIINLENLQFQKTLKEFEKYYKNKHIVEKNKQETLENITEQLQNECHKFVESLPNINYQDGTNLFLFMKLAELTLKIKNNERI